MLFLGSNAALSERRKTLKEWAEMGRMEGVHRKKSFLDENDVGIEGPETGATNPEIYFVIVEVYRLFYRRNPCSHARKPVGEQADDLVRIVQIVR